MTSGEAHPETRRMMETAIRRLNALEYLILGVAMALAFLAGALAASEADVVFACGPQMQKLYETLPGERRGAWAPDSHALVQHVVDALKSGDVVVVKGSLGSRMAPIVAATLRGWSSYEFAAQFRVRTLHI